MNGVCSAGKVNEQSVNSLLILVRTSLSCLLASSVEVMEVVDFQEHENSTTGLFIDSVKLDIIGRLVVFLIIVCSYFFAVSLCSSSNSCMSMHGQST